MIGRTLGHYRIVEKIGEGGMGEVYRAHDERLARDVAVKVLPASVAQDPERIARFEREARAVAKLAHPNILDIYELGDHEGRPYMATELLEGETLRERLSGTSLGWRKATEIGAAVADGLGAAHEAGICHRDLKPSNVFLTADGRIKVLDFGLARSRDAEIDQDVTHAPTVTRHTDPGTVLGTVGYMSPEQVRGESVDQRSDIFSLGCVLYEMVSGHRAFTGDSAVETMNAILKDEPSDISTSGVELPPELAGTIRRCLEKRPQARFQSASDLAYNLRTISSASTPSAARDMPSHTWRGKRTTWVAVGAAAVLVMAAVMIGALRFSRDEAVSSSAMGVTLEWVAVAPFENRTGDASLDPLGQRAVDLIVRRFSEVGMTDSVLTMDAVPYPPGKTTDREEPLQPGSAREPIRGKGPHALVSGSYYLDGEELEFQARLTDYETGELLYAFKPISVVQSHAAEALDDLRERVVVAVSFHWDEEFDVRLMTPPSSHLAWSTFLQVKRASDDENFRALCLRTLELDPDFLVARIWLVYSFVWTQEIDKAASELAAVEDQRSGFTAFERTLFDHCAALANWKPLEALAHSRELVRIAPHIPWVRADAAFDAAKLNRQREVLEILGPYLPTDHAQVYPMAESNFGFFLSACHLLGEYEQQLKWANVGLDLFPDRGRFYYHKAAALVAMGRLEDVDRVIDECARTPLRYENSAAGWVMTSVALELRVHGHRSESDALALRGVEWFERKTIALDIKSRDSSDLRRLSRALRAADQWRDARPYLVELRERGWDPAYVEGALGVIAARTGDHEEAWRIFNEFPDRGFRIIPSRRSYWRACIAANLGDNDRAMELLNEAFAAGFGESIILHIDVDLQPLWDYPPYQELIAPKG